MDKKEVNLCDPNSVNAYFHDKADRFGNEDDYEDDYEDDFEASLLHNLSYIVHEFAPTQWAEQFLELVVDKAVNCTPAQKEKILELYKKFQLLKDKSNED